MIVIIVVVLMMMMMMMMMMRMTRTRREVKAACMFLLFQEALRIIGEITITGFKRARQIRFLFEFARTM